MQDVGDPRRFALAAQVVGDLVSKLSRGVPPQTRRSVLGSEVTMGLKDRLRRLDDRFVPDRSGESSWRSTAMFLFATVATSLVLMAIVMRVFDRTPEPLAFQCSLPAQPVVEDVLDVTVDAAGVEGGTEYWESDGQRVVVVTCTSGSETERGDRAPGYVAGVPPFVLAESEAEGYVSEMRFDYEGALVVIKTASPVDEEGARELVDSWVQQVELFTR